MVKNNVRSGHQCAQTPLSTMLTTSPICDKTKNKAFMKTTDFHMKTTCCHKNRQFSKDHLQGIVTPMFSMVLLTMSNTKHQKGKIAISNVTGHCEPDLTVKDCDCIRHFCPGCLA